MRMVFYQIENGIEEADSIAWNQTEILELKFMVTKIE